MTENKDRIALIIGKFRFSEGIENNPFLTKSEKTTVDWFVGNVKRTNLFFDNDKELTEFREEVSNFAVELYRKKYNKEESK